MGLAQVKVNHYDFEDSLFDEIHSNHFAKDLWPIVYILSDGDTKTAYVGETTDTFARMSTHLKHNKKSKLKSVHLITSEKFNKSATLDIESNLIKYMSGDNKFQLLNGNVGLANHNYYQKREVYWDVFNEVWNQLRAGGIADHSIEHIDNSDLFKYSPYKSLTKEQSEGLYQILQSLATKDFKNTVVQGGAGTGKTVLAIFLFKMLSSQLDDFSFQEFGAEELSFIHLLKEVKEEIPNPKMALVVPMSSFRDTLKKAFSNIKGLKSCMVIGPSEVSQNKYDLLVVDEAHRLRRRVNLGAYYGAFDKACERLGLNKENCSELDWVTMQSDHTVLFYDEGQSIKPSDAKKSNFNALKAQNDTNVLQLKSQFRVRGGNAYVDYIDRLLQVKLDDTDPIFNDENYEFTLFESLEDMVEQVKERNEESGLSRLIAGYAWKWVSNKDKSAMDICIGDVELQWNKTNKDWINTENSVNEVGCIHTTQGYDLNYTGIIFGDEITYNSETDEIEIVAENYHDRNGKQSIKDPKELKEFILNIYKTIMLRGIKGTYVYVCDPELRKYFKKHIPFVGQEEQSIQTENIIRTENIVPFENAIPLYDIKVAAGNFSEDQIQENTEWITLPDGIRPSKDLFACQVVGESMNRIIPNGSYCLFRRYTGGSRNGLIVLAQCSDIHDTDFGSGYTVKEYESKKTYDENGWQHQSIVLKPRSFDQSFANIVLENEELADFVIIGVFERVII